MAVRPNNNYLEQLGTAASEICSPYIISQSSIHIYLFKVNNNRNTRKRCKLCSKLKVKTSERRQCLLLTLNRQMLGG